MKIPIVMGALAALGFAGMTYATRSFVEPTMQERPVVERRLTCPDGYKLYELYPKSSNAGTITFGSGSVCCSTTLNYNGSSYISVEDDKGERWQQGTAPKASEHVCVSKPSKKSSSPANADLKETE